MSDEKLRAAERRWKESGAAEDEAAFLLERVRVGDLTQERLELAAYCGHEGAALAAPGIGESDPAQWAEGLVGFGTPVCVRVLLALAVEREVEMTDLGHRYLQLAERYVVEPTERNAMACESAWGDGAGEGTPPDWIACSALIVSTYHTQAPDPTDVAEGCRDGSRQLGWPRAKEVSGSELGQWLLGYGDPVAERLSLRTS